MKPTHVKIQNKWIKAQIIHVYDNGQVWYALAEGGSGWVKHSYKKKFK